MRDDPAGDRERLDVVASDGRSRAAGSADASSSTMCAVGARARTRQQQHRLDDARAVGERRRVIAKRASKCAGRRAHARAATASRIGAQGRHAAGPPQ